jgi:hypothetical protein
MLAKNLEIKERRDRFSALCHERQGLAPQPPESIEQIMKRLFSEQRIRHMQNIAHERQKAAALAQKQRLTLFRTSSFGGGGAANKYNKKRTGAVRQLASVVTIVAGEATCGSMRKPAALPSRST